MIKVTSVDRVPIHQDRPVEVVLPSGRTLHIHAEENLVRVCYRGMVIVEEYKSHGTWNNTTDYIEEGLIQSAAGLEQVLLAWSQVQEQLQSLQRFQDRLTRAVYRHDESGVPELENLKWPVLVGNLLFELQDRKLSVRTVTQLPLAQDVEELNSGLQQAALEAQQQDADVFPPEELLPPWDYPTE